MGTPQSLHSTISTPHHNLHHPPQHKMNKQIVAIAIFLLLGLSLAFAQTVTTANNANALVGEESVSVPSPTPIFVGDSNGAVVDEFYLDTSAASSLAPLFLFSALF